ncbi:flagellar hook-length control protein FliK, partial [Methylobacterium sp. J-026]|uniref:flagellar hook-length control protein FliK n=1 Tax=Methylobacterium sp. J-026 TaxID=2836624 RepID=UPI001FB972DB
PVPADPGPSPAPAAEAQPRKDGPVAWVRTLQLLQDRVATGSLAAHEGQPVVIARINADLLGAAPEVWTDPHNLQAAIVFALSGGGPAILRRLTKQEGLGEPEATLARGALAYVEGREAEASRLLKDVDIAGLPLTLAAAIGLTQASLTVTENPIRAIALLDQVRLLLPGTLSEEGALRREIFTLGQVGDLKKFEALAIQYLRRFPHSIYAGNFRQRLAYQLTKLDFGQDEGRFSALSRILNELGPESRKDLYLLIARTAIQEGKTRSALLAADRALRPLPPREPGGAPGAALPGRRRDREPGDVPIRAADPESHRQVQAAAARHPPPRYRPGDGRGDPAGAHRQARPAGGRHRRGEAGAGRGGGRRARQADPPGPGHDRPDRSASEEGEPVNPISATVQKAIPQPDRDVSPPQSEADAPNAPETGAKRGFSAALRAASGRPAAPRGDSDTGEAAEPDGIAGTAESVPAAQALLAGPPSAADAANATAAILANILNAVTPAGAPAAPTAAAAAAGAPAAATAGDAKSRPGTAGAAAVGATGGDAAAIGTAASAPAATAGSGALPAAGTILGAANTATARPEGIDPGRLPKVAVLDRAVHFKPVVAKPILRPPALATPPASVDGTGARPQAAQAGLPELTATKPQPNRAGLPELVAAAPGVQAQSLPQNQGAPAPDPAGAAARAAGAGLEKADVTALADTRAITGIARTGLASAGGSEAADAPGPTGLDGTAPSLPAGALPTIAAAIKDEIDRAAATDSAPRVQADPAVRTGPDGPVRVLRIQLRPEDLGTVTVELRLTNGQLETHLRASQPETAALLHRDAAILTDLLKQANYQAEVTVAQARPAEAGGFSGNAPAQGQPGFSGGARPGQGGDRQRQADQGPAAGRREGERGDDTIRPRDGGVYL